MASAYAPRWKRILFRIPRLTVKCPQGNNHWFWDRLCFCGGHQHCGDWHGGIFDMKLKVEYQKCPQCNPPIPYVKQHVNNDVAKDHMTPFNQFTPTAPMELSKPIRRLLARIMTKHSAEPLTVFLVLSNMPYEGSVVEAITSGLTEALTYFGRLANERAAERVGGAKPRERFTVFPVAV